MTGTPGHQQYLHQWQESCTHRICRMGFSCSSFVQSMEDFGCIRLWGQVVGAADLKCAHALCILLLGDDKIRDGYTLLASQTGIQFHHHVLFHQSLPECTTNSESFVIPMKKSCSATLLKREIYLTLMKLFIQHSKKIKQEKSRGGWEACETSLQENKAFTWGDPGFGGERSYMYGCEPSCDL